MTPEIRPCHNPDQLRRYIDTYWRRGHILARNPAMFAFTYGTPWVDRRVFPQGISVLGLYDGPRLVGFLGAIVAPYPRPQSYWLALWHVLPELKGGGHGGQLLARMQSIAENADGWIGTFGAGPEALPVYLKRGYCVRAARHWCYLPDDNDPSPARNSPIRSTPARPIQPHSTELLPDAQWFKYRYREHPVYKYELRTGGAFRTEENEWGRVTHVCWLADHRAVSGAAAAQADVQAVYAAESAQAVRDGHRYLLDAWSFDCPGPGWRLAPADLPSVFHPVEARGNLTYAVGRPFIVAQVHKGDCDQDRPNLTGAAAGVVAGTQTAPT